MRREYYFYLPWERHLFPRTYFRERRPSTTPRESEPSRIDRFKIRELCVAVIPRCNDLSITSGRAVLYALLVLSSRFRSSRTGGGLAVPSRVAHRLFAIRARGLESSPRRYRIFARYNAAVNINYISVRNTIYSLVYALYIHFFLLVKLLQLLLISD